MTERLGIKRKLTNAQKMKLARHAWAKFIDPKLREKELAALQKLKDVIIAAADAIPAAELKTLRKHSFIKTFRRIDLPYRLTVVTGEKEFEVDGKTVTRSEKQAICRPRDFDCFSPYDMAMAMTGGTTNDKEAYKHNGKFDRHIDLGRDIEVPASPGSYCQFNGEYCLAFNTNHNGATGVDHVYFDGAASFMNPKIEAGVRALYVAANLRVETEGKMAMAASRLISASTYYSQILEFWPEAAEIEGDLFEDRLPSAVSLVTISDEDKALLCRNMRSRGVKGSDLCKVAA